MSVQDQDEAKVREWVRDEFGRLDRARKSSGEASFFVGPPPAPPVPLTEKQLALRAIIALAGTGGLAVCGGALILGGRTACLFTAAGCLGFAAVATAIAVWG